MSIKPFEPTIKQTNKICPYCYRPLTKNSLQLCRQCMTELKTMGGSKRVMLSEVFPLTINYQQSLYKKIFKYNADRKYRGNREDRIQPNITNKEVEDIVNRIKYKLLSVPNKKLLYHINYMNKLGYLDEICKRALLYFTLQQIVYYKLNTNIYESEQNYISSITYNLIGTLHKRMWYYYTKNNINDTKYKLAREDTKFKYNVTLYRYLYNITCSCSLVKYY